MDDKEIQAALSSMKDLICIEEDEQDAKPDATDEEQMAKER